MQQSLARQYYIQPTLDQSFATRSLTIPRVREQIVGLRFEQQITPYLSSFTRLEHTVARDRSQSAYSLLGESLHALNHARGLQVPFAPEWQGVIGFNYVDRSGTKLQLVASFLSRQFIDVSPGRSIPFGNPAFDRKKRRPSTGTHALFDLRLAKEPSVEMEYSLTVGNLFNTRVLDWPDYPKRGRFWMLNLARRF